MIKTKYFDCVEMKRKGAEGVMKDLEGLSREEQLVYWGKLEEASQKRMEKLAASGSDLTPEAFKTWLAEQMEAFEKEQTENDLLR